MGTLTELERLSRKQGLEVGKVLPCPLQGDSDCFEH